MRCPKLMIGQKTKCPRHPTWRVHAADRKLDEALLTQRGTAVYIIVALTCVVGPVNNTYGLCSDSA